MAAGAYQDILNRARRELNSDERLRLADELSNGDKSSNGIHDGRTLFDALSARGLIGFMTDAPSDLSTNPKYMEGFGAHGE